MNHNRLGGNTGDDANDHVFMYEESGNLCDVCRFQSKCHKYMTIMQTLQILEMQMFKEFTINLDTIPMVTHCPTFVMDPMSNVTFEEESE